MSAFLANLPVGDVPLRQTTDCDASAYAGECGIRLPTPAAEAYRLCRGLIAFHGFVFVIDSFDGGKCRK